MLKEVNTAAYVHHLMQFYGPGLAALGFCRQQFPDLHRFHLKKAVRHLYPPYGVSIPTRLLTLPGVGLSLILGSRFISSVYRASSAMCGRPASGDSGGNTPAGGGGGNAGLMYGLLVCSARACFAEYSLAKKSYASANICCSSGVIPCGNG